MIAYSKAKTTLDRVTLEMSLKPFYSMEINEIDKVCEEAIRQWLPLTTISATCSLLLWVADGSEILNWSGDEEAELEWGRYIGFANPQHFDHISGESDPKIAIPYKKNPAVITYRDLRKIVASFKTVAMERFGIKLEVGATFDPGPEFAYSDFKYKDHPEINRVAIGDREISLNASYVVVCPWSKLVADTSVYAGFPDGGIPEGTTFGTFLGKQCESFLPSMGFDYIWFSNGFGYSCFPWTYLGANFNGKHIPMEDRSELAKHLLSFWEDFTRECPGYPIEVRGTNFSSGMEIAKDGVPLLEMYNRGYISYPSPNSPWGPLNNDFGLEIAGYMSRIAYLPGKTYPYRFYPNDPWFWQNPWWDLFDRQPHDIYLPLSVGRLNSYGGMEPPGIIEFLTIDTEKGELNPDCAAEIIPHIKRALRDFPDRPGLLTWLYPFREYNVLADEDNEETRSIFYEEWFVRNAINQGLPLNTVISTDEFMCMQEEALQLLQSDTVLLIPGSLLYDEWAIKICNYVRAGGKVLIYGTIKDPAVCELINIQLDSVALEGEMDLELNYVELDHLKVGKKSEHSNFRINHIPLISDGGLLEKLNNPEDRYTVVRATVRQQNDSRVFALTRSKPDWQGGRVGWVRGSLPFRTGAITSLPVRQDSIWSDTSLLVRYALADFGYSFIQEKYEPQANPAMLFITRKDNGYWFNGYKSDTTVSLKFGFPDGAPLLIGHTAYVDTDHAYYSLDRVCHTECRVFVRQEQAGTIMCKENQPYPTRLKRSVRTITVTNLHEAEVTIYPPLDALRSGLVEVSQNGKYLDISEKITNQRLVLDALTGTIQISW